MPFPFSFTDALAASALSTGTLSALVYLLFPRCRTLVRGFVKSEISKISDLEIKLAVVLANGERRDDELAFIRAAVLRQGEEMRELPKIAESMRASASAVQDMAQTMKEIHGEVKDHTKQLARWDGFMEAWDGNERRGIKRHNRSTE